MNRFGAVVLAAGYGRRMGGRKLELPWGEQTVLEATIGSVRRAGVGEVVVVLGAEAERLAPLAESAGARWVLNPNHELGMLTSVQAGLASLGEVAGAFVLPGDHPLVQPSTMTALGQALAPPWGMVIPHYHGQRGHPLLLAGDLFAAVAELDLAVGLRQLRERLPERVAGLEVDDPGVVADLDRPEDYARWQAVLKKIEDSCESTLKLRWIRRIRESESS
ncbi:MAG: nucleotidyltransferase family protein [Armatimonadetes bacterium]|nr:nucleotidyltransferase family protein [Armatimonadota bacterium]